MMNGLTVPVIGFTVTMRELLFCPEASVEQVSTIGLDIAKHVFQVHGADAAAEGFPAGRDFAAWLGLTPLQKSTGGKQKLGSVSKRGERTIRRLLIIGASAVVQQASRRGAPKGSWLAQMLARKPKMLVIVALANKIARIIWALLVKGGTYRTPVAAA
jgi:Transposase IS116/IS110/IS902 family